MQASQALQARHDTYFAYYIEHTCNLSVCLTYLCNIFITSLILCRHGAVMMRLSLVLFHDGENNVTQGFFIPWKVRQSRNIWGHKVGPPIRWSDEQRVTGSQHTIFKRSVCMYVHVCGSYADVWIQGFCTLSLVIYAQAMMSAASDSAPGCRHNLSNVNIDRHAINRIDIISTLVYRGHS